jgi:hypothetical protein
VDGPLAPRLRVSFPLPLSQFPRLFSSPFFSRLASELHERFVERDGC